MLKNLQKLTIQLEYNSVITIYMNMIEYEIYVSMLNCGSCILNTFKKTECVWCHINI